MTTRPAMLQLSINEFGETIGLIHPDDRDGSVTRTGRPAYIEGRRIPSVTLKENEYLKNWSGRFFTGGPMADSPYGSYETREEAISAIGQWVSRYLWRTAQSRLYTW